MPTAVSVARLDQLMNTQTVASNVTSVFLSTNEIAVLVSYAPWGARAEGILILQWSSAGFRLRAAAEKPDWSDDLFAVSGGRLIVSSGVSKFLYSTDLKTKWVVPVRVMSAAFPRTRIIGEIGHNRWKTRSAESPFNILREGVGDLLSVSDDLIVTRVDDVVRTETAGGSALGSIQVSKDTFGARVAEVASARSLLLDLSTFGRLVDFRGKEITQLHPPDGWGFRHGWSADGARVLFDHFTRTVPFWSKLPDLLIQALGGPQESNGEAIRVESTKNGGICFDLESTAKLLGVPGKYHADLSPDGRLVVVSTQKTVSIYRLPDECGS